MSTVCRREAIFALTSFLMLPFLSGCDRSTRKKAAKILVIVGRRSLKITNVVFDLYQMAIEIKAVIDGTDETVMVNLTQEQADSLKAGGELVIQDADGKQTPVSYSKK